MQGLISANQSAFVSGRSIIDNILLSHDLVRDCHRQGDGSRCLLKLDIQKAYDLLDWSFLQQVLTRLNFPPTFISWIKHA